MTQTNATDDDIQYVEAFSSRKRVTVAQAAELTGLSEYTLRMMIHQKRLPYFRTNIGRGKFLICPGDLEAAVARESLNNILPKDNNVTQYGTLRVISEKLGR